MTDDIIALDPGPSETGYCILRRGVVLECGTAPNEQVKQEMLADSDGWRTGLLAIEMIASYGMPVGREVFETCLWIGRFIEAHHGEHVLVYRKDVKLHLCGTSRAKDANVRQSLIDQFGPGKPAAVGTKKSPGPLYRVKGHAWSALAVAVTARYQLAGEMLSSA